MDPGGQSGKLKDTLPSKESEGTTWLLNPNSQGLHLKKQSGSWEFMYVEFYKDQMFVPDKIRYKMVLSKDGEYIVYCQVDECKQVQDEVAPLAWPHMNGLITEENVVHLFHAGKVYVYRDLNMISQYASMLVHVYPLTVLTYAQYFTCTGDAKAKQFTIKTMPLQMVPNQSILHTKIIYGLFALHFLLIISMVVLIVVSYRASSKAAAAAAQAGNLNKQASPGTE